MAIKFDFIVHHWAPTHFGITKAYLKVFALLRKINNQLFSGHCNGVNYIWHFLIKYLVMLWNQSQIVLHKHHDLSVINVICVICEWSDTFIQKQIIDIHADLGRNCHLVCVYTDPREEIWQWSD